MIILDQLQTSVFQVYVIQKLFYFKTNLAMTLRRIYDVKDNELIIKLPDSFRDTKRVIVIIEATDTKAQKLLLMQQATTDPLFLADVQEIGEDFGAIEHETL